jgi:hypothetical protein
MSKRQRKKEPRFPTGIPDLVRVSMEDPDHHSASGSGDHSHCFAMQGTVAPCHVILEPDINTQLATIAAERGDSFFILNLEHFFHYGAMRTSEEHPKVHLERSKGEIISTGVLHQASLTPLRGRLWH